MRVLGGGVVLGLAFFGPGLVDAGGVRLFLIGMKRLGWVLLFLPFLLEFFEFVEENVELFGVHDSNYPTHLIMYRQKLHKVK